MSSMLKTGAANKGGGDPRERYEILTKIGKGAYGYVCKALDTHTNTLVAIKIINLEDAGDEVEDVHQEIAVMSNISCPQLTKYFSSFVHGANLWIIMEYLEAGSLLDLIKESGPLSEPFVAYIMRELLSALAYLHSERKIHRDVKAGNILVAADGSVKLADFGVTGQLTDSIDKRQTKIGTPFWMAPEVISQSAYDGCADVWSAGITAIELCKGAPPYANRIHPFQAILLIPKNPPPVLEGAFSDEFKDFVASCLVKAPAARPSAATLLRHPFITGVTGVPPAWKTFIHNKVEELRIKSASMSADESMGDMHQNGMDTSGTGDWNFTSRTGMSGTNSRSHSRSNSQMGGFSQPPEGMTSCLSGADSFSRSNPVSAAPSMTSRSHSKSGDLSYVAAHMSVSKLRLEGLRSTSSELAEQRGNGDDEELVLSDAEGVTPNSGRGKTTFFGPGTDTSENYEGISFPSTYPSKTRHLPIPPKLVSPDTAGAKSAAARSLLESPGNSASPRSSLSGAPPRPKSLTLAHDPNPLSLRSASSEWGAAPGELQRTVSKQEERISTLLEELQALRMENSLLKSISAPYLHALELLAKHREEAVKLEHSSAHAVPTSGTALTSMDSFQSISASIQQIVYADDADADAQQQKSDQLVSLVESLATSVPAKSSPQVRSIVAPALQHLRHRVHTACAVANNTTTNNNSNKSSDRDRRMDELAQSTNNVLNVLTVALGALDTTDSNNPVRKAQQSTRAMAAAAKDKQRQEEIDLSAPTPKAVHHGDYSAHTPPGADATETEVKEENGIDGVGSVDLLTLLTAYLEEDLQSALR